MKTVELACGSAAAWLACLFMVINTARFRAAWDAALHGAVAMLVPTGLFLEHLNNEVKSGREIETS